MSVTKRPRVVDFVCLFFQTGKPKGGIVVSKVSAIGNGSRFLGQYCQSGAVVRYRA